MICNAINKNKQKQVKEKKDLFLILIKDPQKFTHIAFTLLIVMLGIILGIAIGYDFVSNKGDNIDKYINYIDKYINYILAFLGIKFGIKLGGDKILNKFDKYINHILALLGIKLGGDKILNKFDKKNENEEEKEN